ncbi:uncharacterized protein LOC127813766 [Diospyros lotus]|uniref:uncharacterized protein LOC127813766 n=1 Tax=Diospyros lotus TaxID=55363 RepID=UPI00224EBC4D|nr:uncharacterized protein LOC127813766 [Diospyros lotus]
MVMWNLSKVALEPLGCSPQVIHCKISCLVSLKVFNMSFIYGLHSIVSRRPLWNSIMEFGMQCSNPWLLLVDFNNVLRVDERFNGADVFTYEISDCQDYYLSAGLSDLQSMRCFFTWTNNSVLSKIDRVLVNPLWWAARFSGLAHFLPPGCLSDHSTIIVSLFDQVMGRKKPFGFFNMWSNHEDFQTVVESTWRMNVRGNCQFVLCKKLFFLKEALKKLNANHFSHISVRGNRASKALEDAQLQLSCQPDNEVLQGELLGLCKEAKVIEDAEHLFFSHKAKCSFLRDSDR